MFMKKEAKLFVGFCIGLGLSFLLCGFSLIRCFVFGFKGDEIMSDILEITYLFMHLIIVAIIFYFAFRAIKFGSFFINNLTVDQYGNKYLKKHITFIVLSVLFLGLSIYATLAVIGLKVPLYDLMGLIIWHDLMNAGYLLTMIFVSFVIYPYVNEKRIANAE